MGFIQQWNLYNNRELQSVQHGEVTLSSGTSVDDTLVAVVKNKSFLMFTYNNEENTETPNTEFIRGYIVDGTTIRFETNGAVGDDINIAWTVIEFKAVSNFSVQHLTGTLTSGNEAISINAVDQNHAFPIYSYTTDDTVFDSDNYSAAQITSSTNCQIRSSGINGNKYALQIVEYEKWDVTEYTDMMGQTDVTENLTITTVDQSETMLFATVYDTGTGAVANGSQFVTSYFNSDSQLQTQRRVSGHTLEIIYYVVETRGAVLCDHSKSESILTGNSTGIFTHVAIDWNFSTYQSRCGMNGNFGRNQTDTLSRGEDLCQKFTNVSPTSAVGTRGFTSAATTRGVASVYDFTKS